MKEIKGFTPKQTVPARADKLPAGGYIAKILEAKIIEYTWGEVLCVNFDIADGEHKGHFMARFKADANSEFGQKWKGTYRLTIERADGKFEDSLRSRLEHFVWAVQASNPGYTWDWNEAGLKGKWLGVLFRNKEWEFGGKTGWMTECSAVTSALAIRSGDYEVPADKPLPRKAGQPAAASAADVDIFAAPASAPAAPAKTAPEQDGFLIAGEECPF